MIQARLLVPAFTAFVAVRGAAQCLPERLPTGASTRALAMGDANIASADDDVIFYGPAQLAVARGTSASVERYSDQLVGGTMSSTARIASGGIGIGAQIVDGRNDASCQIASLGPTGTFVLSPAPRMVTEMQAIVGIAQTFRKLHLGVAARYAGDQAGDERTSRVMLEAGVSRSMTVGDFIPLNVAVAVQNIGTSASDTLRLQTPLRAALGFASGGPVGPIDLAALGEVAVERNGTLSPFGHGRVIAGLGTEIGYEWLDGYSIAVRLGERVPPTRTDLRHFTFGAGLTLDRVSIDYAAEDQVGFRIAHRIGVRLR